MPFQKGEGGRPKGAKNKVPNTARELFEQLGGPCGEAYAQQLHTIATAPHGDVHARLKALAILGPYLWGKPKENIELSGSLAIATRVVHEYHDA